MDKWDAILESIEASPKKITLLPPDKEAAQAALNEYGLNPQNTLGAVISGCGGIVIDDIIRVYGGGETDILERNALYRVSGVVTGEDIFGGLFILTQNGGMCYFAPDTLDAEDMEMGYASFLHWAVTGDTDLYYSHIMNDSIKAQIRDIPYDCGISLYPPLWTAEGKDTLKSSMKIIPMREIVGAELETAAALDG